MRSDDKPLLEQTMSLKAHPLNFDNLTMDGVWLHIQFLFCIECPFATPIQSSTEIVLYTALIRYTVSIQHWECFV